MFVSCAVHSQRVRWLLVRDAAWRTSTVVRLQCRSKSLSPCWYLAGCLPSQAQVAGQAGWYMAGNSEITPGQTLALSRHRRPVTTQLWDVWRSFVSHGILLLLLMRLIWHTVTFPLLERHPAVSHVPDFHTVTTAAVDTLSGFIYQGDDWAGRAFGEFCQSRGPPAG